MSGSERFASEYITTDGKASKLNSGHSAVHRGAPPNAQLLLSAPKTAEKNFLQFNIVYETITS